MVSNFAGGRIIGMIRILAVVFFVLAQIAIGAAAAPCKGPNPMITSVVVQNVTHDDLDKYHIVGTVVNWGQQQASNTLQSVEIYQDGVKLDQKGIPPLGHLQSTQFFYTWTRSPDADKYSTDLDFKIRMVQGSACFPNDYLFTF
jgi:hypothetical protein